MVWISPFWFIFRFVLKFQTETEFQQNFSHVSIESNDYSYRMLNFIWWLIHVFRNETKRTKYTPFHNTRVVSCKTSNSAISNLRIHQFLPLQYFVVTSMIPRPDSPYCTQNTCLFFNLTAKFMMKSSYKSYVVFQQTHKQDVKLVCASKLFEQKWN